MSTVVRASIVPFVLLAACAEPAAAPGVASRARAEVEYPGATWETGSPRRHGLSADGLAAMHAVAADMGSTCLVVVHDGVMVSEWYADGYAGDTPHANLFSTTKSITSTLAGIAQDEGLLDVDAPASDYVSEWAGTDSAGVTVRNLLSNDSGRHWSMASDYGALLYGADQTTYAISLGQDVAPGTHWEYNNAAIQTLERVLEVATGRDVEDYAQEKLFAPIGMTATLTRDAAGNPLVYQGVQSSCYDMARFGHLALQGGRWKSRQVVSAAWLEEATTPSTPLNDAYGYLWWLNTDGHVVEPSFPARVEYDGQIAPSTREEVYAAIGAFGQLVVVDPVDGYVIVRLQEITNLEEAIATDPDPLGVSKLETLMSAFEAAKL